MQKFYHYGWGFSLLLGVFLTGCTAVQTQPLSTEKTFLLTTQVVDAPTDFDLYRMEKKAEAVCAEGYEIQSQSFGAQAELPASQLACVKGCGMVLQWKIHCSPRKTEPFSIFGNF